MGDDNRPVQAFGSADDGFQRSQIGSIETADCFTGMS